VEPLVVAGLAAHGCVVGLTAYFTLPPLLTALVATLLYGGVGMAYGRRPGAVVGPAPGRLPRTILADSVVLVIVAAAGWLTGRTLGSGAAFYCEPLVPWRIEIALFGSFGLAYFSFGARQRRHAWATYPLGVLALLWIAPFYGFFSAPLFLGVSLNTTRNASTPIDDTHADASTMPSLLRLARSRGRSWETHLRHKS
jgi:hypothetical protein